MPVAANNRILIVEDEVLIADYIKQILEDNGFSSVKIALDRDEALMYFRSFCPDLVLMDININGRDTGIELAMQRNNEANLIFITAQNDMATMKKALDTNPNSYLTKPIRETELMAAMQLVFNSRQNRMIHIKDGHAVVKISQDDILFIKAENIYLDIHTAKKIYTIRHTLEKFLLELDAALFCKTHRSYIVNRKAITRMESKAVYIGATEIPLSRNASLEL